MLKPMWREEGSDDGTTRWGSRAVCVGEKTTGSELIGRWAGLCIAGGPWVGWPYSKGIGQPLQDSSKGARRFGNGVLEAEWTGVAAVTQDDSGFCPE